MADTLNQIFTGLSIASILLLVSLGLAIIYGTMGVINLAHGEFV
ncbi:MAG TPA: urea ABC transporter permease subunit UrtB, partial [Methylocella sp.]|nr:urea ABC transporter permease subunit UrtB [Methylocella sp.]